MRTRGREDIMKEMLILTWKKRRGRNCWPLHSIFGFIFIYSMGIHVTHDFDSRFHLFCLWEYELGLGFKGYINMLGVGCLIKLFKPGLLALSILVLT